MYKVLSSVGLVSLIVKTAVFIIFIRVLQSFMAFFYPFLNSYLFRTKVLRLFQNLSAPFNAFFPRTLDLFDAGIITQLAR